MRTALPHLDEAEPFESPDNVARLEDGQGAHGRSADLYELSTEELSLEPRITVLQEHFDDLVQILTELLFRSALAVSPGEPRYVANIEPSIGVSLNDRGKCSHA